MIDLNRFIKAQDEWIDKVKIELKSKKKVSHWIWFIFPQLKGLGNSFTSDYYGIDNINDAKKYYENIKLRNNLIDCLSIISEYEGINELKDCLGELDTKKLYSCVSLFYLATKQSIFKYIIDKFFNGKLDEEMILLLKRGD